MDKRKNLTLTNIIGRRERDKNPILMEGVRFPLRINSTRDAPAIQFSLSFAFCSRSHVSALFPGISVVKYREKYVVLDLFAVEAADSYDHDLLSIFDDCYFFFAFCREAKSAGSLRSTRLVSQNKSGGHVTVCSCDD